MSMDELPDKRDVRRIVRADTGEVIGEISYSYEIGPRRYVPEYDEVVPGVCTQCAPGHDRGDGRCARHGKEIRDED